MTATVRTLDYGERGKVVVYDDAASLAVAAAELFAQTAEVAPNGGAVCIALSGGSTPKAMAALLAQPPYRDQIPWDRLQLFWGDERWVPESSPESNAGEARRILLDHVPMPAKRIHPFPTTGITPETAADSYAGTLRAIVGRGSDPPAFDLIYLGMGDDGHTASLFPGTAAIHEQQALVVAHFVPKLDMTRLTLTPPVLNAGRQVAFLVAGTGKATTLARVLDGPQEPDTLPSQIVRPGPDRLRWLVDRAAAAELKAAGHG